MYFSWLWFCYRMILILDSTWTHIMKSMKDMKRDREVNIAKRLPKKLVIQWPPTRIVLKNICFHTTLKWRYLYTSSKNEKYFLILKLSCSYELWFKIFYCIRNILYYILHNVRLHRTTNFSVIKNMYIPQKVYYYITPTS